MQDAPQPSESWDESTEWYYDSVATDENKQWPDEKALKGTKDENTIILLRNSGKIAVCMMWFFALVFISSMGVWLFHFLTPWGWLNEFQLSKIQTVIFSGSLGALVSAFAQKHITE